MTPHSFTEKDGIVTYHYTFKELRWFIETGRREGNVGFIVTNRDNNNFWYRGYGTYENPLHKLHTLVLPNLFGKSPTDEEICTKPKPLFRAEDMRVITMKGNSTPPDDISLEGLINYINRKSE